MLLSVELCSLTVQRDDASMANLVASGLFGDGAAAVVLVGDRRAAALGLDGPHVVATRSRLYPDTERVMGWDIGGSGFRIVLAASVADVVEEHLGHDVTAFLGDHDLKVADVGSWVAHPGGPKVLDAMTRTLGLPPERTGPHLAVAGAGGQPVVGLGAARARRPGWPNLGTGCDVRRDARDGTGLLLRAGAAPVVSATGSSRRPGRARRRGAGRRARREHPARRRPRRPPVASSAGSGTTR